jgi:hypothetical protein
MHACCTHAVLVLYSCCTHAVLTLYSPPTVLAPTTLLAYSYHTPTILLLPASSHAKFWNDPCTNCSNGSINCVSNGSINDSILEHSELTMVELFRHGHSGEMKVPLYY